MNTVPRGPIMTPRRRAAGVALGTVMMVTSACADPPFPPASAYHDAFTTPANIIGFPDTFTSVGQAAEAILVADDRFRDVPRRWFAQRIDSATCPGLCSELSVDRLTGRFVATPTSYTRRWEVQVQMGAQWYRDTIVLRQIPVKFYLDCYYSCHSSSHDTPSEFSINAVQLYDANDVRLFYESDSSKSNGATFTVRDTSVVDLVNGQWRSRFRDGTTWIVREQFGYVDSVQFTVRQRFVTPKLTCPQTASVSDTVRVAVSLTDSAGRPMATPVQVSFSLTRLRDVPLRSRPIMQDGSFVPTEPGDWQVYVDAIHATASHWNACVVQVQ